MTEKRTLLILAKRIDGGTGTFALSLRKLAGIPGSGMAVRILVLEKPSYRKVDGTGLIFHRQKGYYGERLPSLFRTLRLFAQDVAWTARQAGVLKPSAAIGIDIHCNFILMILKWTVLRRIPVILTTHIDLASNIRAHSSRLQSLFLKISVAYFYNRASALVFVSRKLAEDCRVQFSLRRELVMTIYNGIPLRSLPSKPQYSGKTIISVARLVGQKDHDTLLRAFVLVAKKIPAARLLLLSDGQLKTAILRRIRELGIAGRATVTGWVPDIYPYLKKSAVFALSTRREGFGIVLVEAMSQGLPVVSANAPFGPEEVLGKGKYGVLVPVGDEKKMASALVRLLSDYRAYQKMSRHSLERSRDFPEGKMLVNYKNLIDSLAKT